MRALPLVISALVVVAMSPVNQAQRPAPDLSPGVSESLAVERASRVSDLRYQIALDIPLNRSDRISGTSTMTFALTDPSVPLALDFEPNAMGFVRRLTVAGAPVNADVRNGHLILPASSLRAGNNVVAIEFDAGDAPLNRNDDFLYTIFVPARAHEAFPCFDQPDLKARWTLELTVPAAWETLANGAETARASSSGRKRITFAETEPISTYLFAFAAGRFSVEEAQRNGRTFRMAHRETDARKVARNRDALFDLHAAALSWLEQYTGIPYPFGKFDFFLVPAFQFGGMEHPGAVFYNASGLMLDESATQNQLLERASTISHETSHMWFGDLVTMRWFTDVWMKEVFANFMAAKIVNPSFPGVNHDLRFLHAYYPLAYDVDRTAGSNAIRQPLENLKEAGTLYGAIIYQKAPIVMRQLETIMGPDAFRDGLREYLRQHKFGNASWPDLIALLDERTPEDLAAWSHAWVEEGGRPVITTELSLTEGRINRLFLSTRDPMAQRNLTWTQDIQLALGYADRIQRLPVHLSGNRTEVSAARGLPAPLFILPNGGGIAYGEVHLDMRSLVWLADHLPEIGDPLTRGAAWITLWDAMLDAELPPARVLDLTVTALPRETDELNIQRILSYLELANWKFVPDSIRTSRAALIEHTLRDGLEKASTASLKSAYFSALRDVAVTPPTLGWLNRIWAGQETIPGLTLAETDFIVLAQELAVREVPGWRTLIQQQIERTQNPDRKARLQFVVPALSSDAAERDRFFASLADVNNRRHEPWVLDGLRYLHHPLRTQTSLKYVAPSLNLLQEVQRTGDIFFPKRWMDATLSGHRSPEAARVVRNFLDQLPPSYPDRLRRIVLSSADDLFRASDERTNQ
jgi:aminopeptidase N